MLTISQRLESRIERIPDAGCWIWTGAIDNSGYARISVDYKNRQAHRVSFELAKGKIPDGLQIDHLCKVKACVNPNHLEAVTQQENLSRCDNHAKGKFNRLKTHCKNGHEYTDDNIYVHKYFRYGRMQQGRFCKTCHNARRKS